MVCIRKRMSSQALPSGLPREKNAVSALGSTLHALPCQSCQGWHVTLRPIDLVSGCLQLIHQLGGMGNCAREVAEARLILGVRLS